jgi:hypothetical protein
MIKDGKFNASVPSTFLFRIKNETAINLYSNCIFVRDEGHGYTGFKFQANNRAVAYENNNIYMDPYRIDGWSIFKLETQIDHNAKLSGAKLYYATIDGGWSNAITSTVISSSTQQFDSVMFGDIGSNFGGKWNEDYMYWSNCWMWTLPGEVNQ